MQKVVLDIEKAGVRAGLLVDSLSGDGEARERLHGKTPGVVERTLLIVRVAVGDLGDALARDRRLVC